MLRAALMAGLAPMLREHRSSVKQTLAWNIDKGIALTGEAIAAARLAQEQIFERMRSFLAAGEYDVLALPTGQVIPFPVEVEWVTEINGIPMQTYIDWMCSCSRITVTLHPAISVPAGLTPDGLPTGLQLVGRYGADKRLLEIAAGISRVAPPPRIPNIRLRIHPAGAPRDLSQQAGEGHGAAAPVGRPGGGCLHARRAEGPEPGIAHRDEAEICRRHAVLEVRG